jgi:hypothetical protein
MGSHFTPHAPKEAGAVILVVLAHLFFSISLRSRENFLFNPTSHVEVGFLEGEFTRQVPRRRIRCRQDR